VANILDIISNPERNPIRTLWLNGIILTVAVLQVIPSHYLQMRFTSAAARGIEADLRSAITRRLQHLSINFYQEKSSGVIQNKLLRDVEWVQELANDVFKSLPATILTMIVALVITGIRDPWFILFYLATIPASALLIKFFKGPLRKRNRKFRRQLEEMASRLLEMINLVPITRAHGVEATEIERIEEELVETKSAGLALDSMNAFSSASSQVTFGVFKVACLILAAWCIYTGKLNMTIGDLILLTGYFDELTTSTSNLIVLLPDIGAGFEAIESVGEILECPDLEENQGKTPVQELEGRFTFESVGFTYPDTENHALEDFCLEVKAGETIAIVGPSGAGKSTLLNLIIGFLRPTSGKILLDGQDMDTLDLRTYRKFLSVVSQDTVLFDGTIEENILYGTDNIGEETFKKAIEDANALEFINQLPEGVETLIGEDGTKLSGGQRQRLAIARALIRDPKVLILDEATSSLDMASEASIQEALIRLMENRTTFIVAHRLSTVCWADRIVVLDQGKVTQIGSHFALLQQDGIYSQLHSLSQKLQISATQTSTAQTYSPQV
jgi:ATP-binding cassette subfamily B protein